MRKEDIVDAVIERMNALAGIYTQELSGIVENVRWLVTLALAAIGGLAGYRQLVHKPTLSLPFAFVVLILGLALLLFVVTVFRARIISGSLRQVMIKAQTDARTLIADPTLSDNQVEERARNIENELLAAASTSVEEPRWWEFAGLAALILGSLLAAIALFSSELLLLFHF